MTPFPAPLRQFVVSFNAGSFWESHEILEGAWRETGSDFYQGLILVASAWVHVRRANPHGITAQLAKAREKLDPYRPRYLGVDVDALLAASDAADREVETGALPSAPDLKLDPALVRGDEPELGAVSVERPESSQ
jgi:predicted metal-dependent hydrolase